MKKLLFAVVLAVAWLAILTSPAEATGYPMASKKFFSPWELMEAWERGGGPGTILNAKTPQYTEAFNYYYNTDWNPDEMILSFSQGLEDGTLYGCNGAEFGNTTFRVARLVDSPTGTLDLTGYQRSPREGEQFLCSKKAGGLPIISLACGNVIGPPVSEPRYAPPQPPTYQPPAPQPVYRVELVARPYWPQPNWPDMNSSFNDCPSDSSCGQAMEAFGRIGQGAMIGLGIWGAGVAIGEGLESMPPDQTFFTSRERNIWRQQQRFIDRDTTIVRVPRPIPPVEQPPGGPVDPLPLPPVGGPVDPMP